MEDNRIIKLYWDRDELAISETKRKYGRYCYAIAYNILHNPQDAEESENDTYLDAWHAMPPHRPHSLSAFLGKITRRISLDKWRAKNAEKRGGSQVALSLNELAECIPDQKQIDDQLQAEMLSVAIEAFLRRLSSRERSVFLCRYWYFDSIEEIARQFDFTESKVKTMLFRTRSKLKIYLEKEGISL